MRLQARWLFPGDGSCLPNPVLTIRQGHIEHIRSADTSPSGPGQNMAIIPGLINAHTHLEFSDLDAPIEPRRRFADWIEQVIRSRIERSTPVQDRVTRGLHESIGQGTVTLAEIATSDWPIDHPSCADHLPDVIPFREILGLQLDQVDARLALASAFIQQARHFGLPRFGLSPHAPYSLHPDLFSRLCRLAAAEQVPLTCHLAESPAELELLQQGTGPLVELFRRLGLWTTSPFPAGTHFRTFLKHLSLAPRVLIAHGNLLDDDDIRFLAEHRHMSVIYCPRTHAAMQTGDHPWPRMLQAGVNVALGTDSRASNPDLSLWEELRFLKSHSPGGFPDAQLLQLATARAGQALGAPELGTVQAGQAATLCLVALNSQAAQDPAAHLLSGSLAGVMKAGRWKIASDPATPDPATPKQPV